MSTNASGGRRDRRNRRPPAHARSPRLNLDRLTILSARRLHLRLGKYWCTLPTEAMCQGTSQETWQGAVTGGRAQPSKKRHGDGEVVPPRLVRSQRSVPRNDANFGIGTLAFGGA